MCFLDVIARANNANLQDYLPLIINGDSVGLIWRKNISLLNDYGMHFEHSQAGLIWHDKGSEPANSAFLQHICHNMARDGLISGWRDEQYALAVDYHHPAHALIERAAIPYFGACGYGVHVNGLTMKNQLVHMWIARRALDKPTAPNQLDQIAAGGLPHGIDVFANLIKECHEEANIPPELAKQATAVGTVSYNRQSKTGIRSDVMFNYDLWLPPDFVPHNNDGEVSEFLCLPVLAVMELVKHSEQVKFNSALVIIDCCIRHGFITPDHRDYQSLCAQLNQRDSALQTALQTRL